MRLMPELIEQAYILTACNAALRKQLRPGDHYNPLLGFPGLDPHQDSPVEALHTISLGQFRYVWFSTSSKWNDEKARKFAAWLSGSNIEGLPGVPRGVEAHYLVQYNNNLVGKHFKWISQLAVFSLHWGGCDLIMFDLWKATGELGALVWFTKILDMDQYTVRVNRSMVMSPARSLRLHHRPISTSRLRTSSISGRKSIPTASLSNPSSTFSHTCKTTCAGLGLHLCMRWKYSSHQTRYSVSAASSPTTMHQATTSQPPWLAWRGSSTLSAVGGGGTARRGDTFRRAKVSLDTLIQTWPCKHSSDGHQTRNRCLVTYQLFTLARAHYFATPGSVVNAPKEAQSNDCTWDSLFDTIPPARPSGVDAGTPFDRGVSTISRSGDVCCEGSWVFYNTHVVCLVIAIFIPYSVTAPG